MNHSNYSHTSLEPVALVYLSFSLKARQSSILWSVLYRFHSLYHCCHSLSLIAICCHSLYYSLSLFVTCTTRCHSLSLVVTRFTTRCHSLLLVVPLVVIRCYSLYHSLSFVITRSTTRLPFYKRSNISLHLIWFQLNSRNI